MITYFIDFDKVLKFYLIKVVKALMAGDQTFFLKIR